MREYIGADRIEGPLVVAEGYGKAAYGEMVEVHAADGVRLGQVTTAGENLAISELWRDTAGLQPHQLLLRFRGETFHAVVAREMLGRVFNGLGAPRDGLPPPIAEARVEMHGAPLNPTARAYPQHFIETGISAIDGMNTVVRGQKLNVEFPIYGDMNFIGRADEKPVDIDLEDQEPPDRIHSSRQHAVIHFDEKAGVLTIEDLNSANGTYVNRARIYPGQKKQLFLNDVVQIGNVHLKVQV